MAYRPTAAATRIATCTATVSAAKVNTPTRVQTKPTVAKKYTPYSATRGMRKPRVRHSKRSAVKKWPFRFCIQRE
jgi:hypothetical protein